MPENPALKSAVSYAEKGYYVFPIQPGKKIPFKGFAWKEKSTNDIQLIKKAGQTELYSKANWAVDCGKSNLFVLDIDIRPEKNGMETLRKQLGVNLSQFPEKFTIKTPSGGWHYYYSGNGINSASKLGPGLDTRGKGGYVLIPGSKTEKGEYRLQHDAATIPPIPQWLRGVTGKVSERNPQWEVPLTELDQTANTENAVLYLQNDAPPAVSGQGGNANTYNVFCKLRDFALSQQHAVDLVIEYYNERCRPPWTYQDLTRLARNAYTYAKDRPGNATPEALFAETPTSDNLMLCAASIDINQLKPRQWLLGYRYLPGYATLTIAPPGTGKSTLTIVEALSIACGKPLTHEEVKTTGAVWVYNTEDPMDELQKRVLAAARHHELSVKDLSQVFITSGYENPLKFAAMDERGRPVQNEKGVQNIISRIQKNHIRLFVVDPLVRCHSLKENDNDHMDFLMQIFGRISKETGCACSIVHHTPKGKKTQGDMDAARGASALTAAARIVHTVYNMSDKEAAQHGLKPEQAPWFMRIDSAKSNLAPPDRTTKWYEKKSIKLFFDSDQTTGTVAPADLCIAEPQAVDNYLLTTVIEQIALNCEMSLYALAKFIEETGFLNLKYKTISRKIEDLLELPVGKDGLLYQISSLPSGRKVIRCSAIKKQEVGL